MDDYDVALATMDDDGFGCAITATSWGQRRERLERRDAGYAAHFVNDSDAEPTDDNLRSVLSHCVLSPRPASYPAIRSHVAAFRAERVT